MNHPARCPQCGSTDADSRFGAAAMRCRACGAAWHGDTSPTPPASSAGPHEQWFLTLPDGRHLGPLSSNQMASAHQRGSIPPDALVRRGDWTEAVSHSTLLARHAAAVRQAAAGSDSPSSPSPAAPTDSYARQFARNPLGTYFFGPKLAAYAANREVRVKEVRQRHFRRWIYVLLGIFLAASLLPLSAGLIRGKVDVGLGGVLLALMWFFWPAVIYLIGLLMYAGAWFEWGWFFRSVTLRHARAMFGDSGARKFYLGFGGVLMVGGALVSLGGTLLLSGSILFNVQEGRQARLAARKDAAERAREQNLAAMEQNLLDARRRFDQSGKALQEAVAHAEQLEREIADQPDDLLLRQRLLAAQDRVKNADPDYRSTRRQWEQSVKSLDQVASRSQIRSEILEANRQVPPELDFDDAIITPPTERFPVQNVRVAVSQLHRVEKLFDAEASSPRPDRQRLQYIARMIDQQRGYLEQVEGKWGYHSAELDRPSGEERVANLAAVEPASADSPPPREATETSSLGPRFHREGPADAPPSFQDSPQPIADATTTNSPSAARPTADVPARPGPPPFPLLARFDAAGHAVRGRATWGQDAQGPWLITEALREHVLVRLPSPPLPQRYTVEADVTRLEGNGGFFFVLAIQGHQAALVIDGGDELGHRTGLVAVDRQVLGSPGYPDRMLLGTQFPPDQKTRIECSVESNTVVLRREGRTVYRWEGDVERLSLPPFYRTGHSRQVHLGSFHSRYRVEQLRLRMQ